MKIKIRLSDQALKHLEEIGAYTQERHGADQRKKYLEKIYQRIYQLADNPALGKERPDVRPGYRSITEGKHVIFYRVQDTKVEIMAVLHGQLDLKKQIERKRRTRRNQEKDGGRER